MPFDLTIVTVCRNAAGTIVETLRSVAEQKTSDVEYLVIDGASTDETISKVRSHQEIVDHFTSEPDRGLYHAMNKGAELAKGEYVCYLNADDIYLPNAVNTVLSYIKKFPEVDMFYADWIGVQTGNVVRHRKAELSLGWRYKLCHQAIIVRRDILGKNPFNERYKICADFDAIQEWICRGVITKHIPNALVRFSEDGLSNRAVNRACQESIEIAIRRLGIFNSWRFCLSTVLHWAKMSLINIFSINK